MTNYSASQLAKVATERDRSLFETLFDQIPFPAPEEAVFLVNDLIYQDWHERHEEMADMLQVSKRPSSVPGLYKACQLTVPYLVRWGNLDSFHRKCTWALADIGTVDAKAALISLTTAADPELVKYAQKRLDRWDTEHQ